MNRSASAREAMAKCGICAGRPCDAERQLLALLRSGLASGPGIPVTKSYWTRKHKALGRGRA